MTKLHIGLCAWIIQDGNFEDFACGETHRFALEFYPPTRLQMVNRSTAQIGLKHLRDAHYQACGVVRHRSAGSWVVDFGEVMALRKERPPSKITPGVFVEGEIYLGVDPFWYVEELVRIPGIPALMYDWRIEQIEMETAPYIDAPEQGARVRDPMKRGRVTVPKTDAWRDDGGHGDYVLSCTRVSTVAHK